MIVKWQSDTPKMVKWQSDAPKMELKVPSEIKIDGGGYPPYELPVATKEVLGGVKVDGDTINITSDGVISTQKVDLSGVATKVELEEKVSDLVKYTPQTLTDEQKKQARENMGAIDTANGLLPVECILPFGLNTRNQTVFVKNGVMLPLDYSTATGDIKTAISRFSMLMSSTNMTPAMINVSVEAFATLIKNGIFGDDFYGSYTWPSNVLYIYDSQFSPKTVISMWSYYSASDSRKGFALRADKANGNTFTRAYNITASEYANNYISYTSIPLAAYASDSGDTPSIRQVEVASAPTADMQIATKKYVDDSVAGAADAVLYTAQTLTDEQKKQVRENVGAEEVNGGLVATSITNPINGRVETTYTSPESCELLPYDTADADNKFKYLRVYGMCIGIINPINAAYAKESLEFVKDIWNKKYFTGDVFYAYKDPLKSTEFSISHSIYQEKSLLKVSYDNGYARFSAEINTETGVISPYSSYSHNVIVSTNNIENEEAFPQLTMAAAPTKDMEIATKKYVDDHAGGGGGGEAQLNYNISSTATFTEQDKEVIKSAIKFGTGFFIDNCKVIRIISIGSRKVFVVLKPNGATDNHVVGYQVNIDADKNVTSSVFSTFIDYVLIGSNSAISGDIITSDNWETYININAGDWISTTTSDSNLYNAKQLWVIGLNGQNYYEGIYRFDYSAATTVLGDCTSVQFSLGDFTFSYNGTSLNPYLGTILAVYYKT